ncbi:MAG: hypothetical protein L0Z07_08945 [Planctomycetes bacterium]|nr:hypothetical protein [Planctomycetota bacterium]
MNRHVNRYECKATIYALSAMAAWSGLDRGALAAAEREISPRQARPPQWSADVLDAFYPDAREKLEGNRPDSSQTGLPARVVRDAAGAISLDRAPAGSGTAWSKLIDAETIETEIKRLAELVAADVTTPGEFKGGGYKTCRSHFSLLAVLFAVASEYDGQVRWQDAAGGLRELFARAGYNCKVGTDQSYREAAERKQDLDELVRGARPQTPLVQEETVWSQMADRPPLMERLEIAQRDRLMAWLASEREFTRNIAGVRHEAQMVALLADVIGRKGFEYWDDATYADSVRGLRQAASDLGTATDVMNYQQARQALDRATKACNDCHDGYRE